jgi:hypothetical protein
VGKVDPFGNIQIEDFKKVSKVDPSVPEPKSAEEIIFVSKLDEAGFDADMVKEEEPNGHWTVVNGCNGQLWKSALNKELDSLD